MSFRCTGAMAGRIMRSFPQVSGTWRMAATAFSRHAAQRCPRSLASQSDNSHVPRMRQVACAPPSLTSCDDEALPKLLQKVQAPSQTRPGANLGSASLCLCGRAKPSFGWPQDAQPSHCGRCKSEGMIRLRGPKCRCGRAWPVFGMLGDERPACCRKCKEEGMIDIRNPRCKCGKARPSFGFADNEQPTACSQCKTDEMINIASPRCQICSKIACYPDTAGKSRQFCAAHSAEVTSAGTKREERETSSRASLCLCGRGKSTFGWSHEAGPTCCGKCKAEGMVKLRGPKCRCGRAEPVFGMPGDARPSCCSKCKADGMVDIKNRKCLCRKSQPNFGFPNDARPTCCTQCKKEGMVDIISRRCECDTAVPCFGYAGDARATCCSKCKRDGMVDIKNLRCNCGKARPSFGFSDDVRPTCCKQCKAAEMVNIISPKCKICNKLAFYPDEAGRPRQLCAVHSAEVGAHVLSSPRRSRIASECFDALEAEWDHKLPFRYRLGTWSGEEVAGLVPSRNLQPDAYDPEARKIFEFLGNYFHGFPPHHPQHDSFVCVGGRPAAELHAETMARLDLFLAEGFEVVYVWEHDFIQWQREVAMGTALSLATQLIQHGAAADKKKLAARADVGERVLGGLRSWSVVGCLCTWYC
ncbi:unnamed protein product [Effrenium voratum]|uniref:Uncharacterized protein n=1 Tax=Effrenium voratum TaxID=2562239 RepID=A0AA36J3D7_9DINO|nr:unnamed protein product [Effrenium voratum]